MSSIERTAYPRFALGRILKEHELEQFYSLTVSFRQACVSNTIYHKKLIN